MNKINKIAGYRAMIGKTKSDFAKLLGITPAAYGVKEKNKRFTDDEKIIIIKFLKSYFHEISIETLFF